MNIISFFFHLFFSPAYFEIMKQKNNLRWPFKRTSDRFPGTILWTHLYTSRLLHLYIIFVAEYIWLITAQPSYNP